MAKAKTTPAPRAAKASAVQPTKPRAAKAARAILPVQPAAQETAAPAPAVDDVHTTAPAELVPVGIDADGEIKPLDELGYADAAPATPSRYRVRLPGVKVRGIDPEKGTIVLEDYLEVEASNPGEAWMRFKEYNGIRSTTQEPEISPVG
jgi:hypothetical protein